MPLKDEEVDWRAYELRLGGTEGEAREIGCELLGEHVAEYRTRPLYGCLLGLGELIGRPLFSDQFADLVREKKRCSDEQ